MDECKPLPLSSVSSAHSSGLRRRISAAMLRRIAPRAVPGVLASPQGLHSFPRRLNFTRSN